MSKIYKMIEEQVNILLHLFLKDKNTGQIQYGDWIQGPEWFKLAVQLLTVVVFLAVVLFFGLYLWNFGLQPAFPGLIAKLTPADPNQAANPYTQLVITLVALMMFL